MEGLRDAYRVLQVDPSAEPIVIQAAYRALAKKVHPDGDQPDANRMAELNRAYSELRDPDLRRRYDTRQAMGLAQPIPVASPGRPIDVWESRRAAPEPNLLDFGRYAGWAIADLARHDPDYLRWLCRHSSGIRFREAIARVLPREPDLVRRGKSVA